MSAKQILVAFDGTCSALRALEAAANLAGYGSSLAVVYVQCHADQTGATLELAREHLLRRQLLARYLEPRGVPAEQILSTADELGTDLIVVGRRNASTTVLGSVSSAVVTHASCDVLVAS